MKCGKTTPNGEYGMTKLSNVLFYTVIARQEPYVHCCAMLKNSLLKTLPDCNFIAYVTEDFYEKAIEIEPELKSYLQILNDGCINCDYVGHLKYHQDIFSQNYDFFVFVDPDILWFYKDIEKIIDTGFIIREGIISKEDIWHTWPFVWDEKDKEKFNGHYGINACCFGLPQKTAQELASFAKEIILSYNNRYDPSEYPSFWHKIQTQAGIEQGILNKFLITNMLSDNFYDFNKVQVNMAVGGPNIWSKDKITKYVAENVIDRTYHFIILNHGETKYEHMKHFLEECGLK
jgi:hypothetical protein